MADTLHETLVEPVSGLTYRVRAATAAAGGAPCLVMLHGVGANESGFIELARRFDPKQVVILARGPLVLGPQQFAWFQVNFTANGPAINPVQAEQARVKLIAFIGQLAALHGVDPARIVIAGFSQGGIMSASVALTRPGKLAGFGIWSGRVLPEILPMVVVDPRLAQLPAFVSHGVQDQVLGIHFARNTKQVLDGFGVPLRYHEYEGGHIVSGAMLGDFTAWLNALFIS